MSNFRSLLRVEFLYIFDYRNQSGSESAKRHRSTLITYIILIPAILLMSSTYSYMIAFGLDSQGGAYLVIPIMASASCVATFMTGIMKPSNTLFKAKYNDILFSMPIKLSTIIAARLANIYIFTLAVDALIMIPAAVVYAIAKAPGVLFYVNFIICLAALPLIPLALASVIGTVITAVASRLKYKNLFTIIFSVAALAAYLVLVFSFSFNTMDEQATAQLLASLSASITRVYPPVALIGKAIVDESLLYMLLFTAISILAAGLFCLILSKFYLQISSRVSGTAKRKKAVDLSAQKASSVRSALLMREVKRYLSIPVYVLNTFTGMAMLALLTGAIVIAGEDVLQQIISIPGASETLAAMLPFIMGFCITLTTTSSSSVSLEGRQLWILRSSPVRESDIFGAKIGLNLITTMPITLICSIILALAFELRGLSLVLLIVTPLAYCALTSVLGLVINLHFPKLNWSAEVQAVKQSTSVLISIMVGMLISMGPLVASASGVDPIILQEVVAAVLIVLTALLAFYLNKRGNALWDRIIA